MKNTCPTCGKYSNGNTIDSAYHEHDCDYCIYMGSIYLPNYESDHKYYDFYYCKSKNTLIQTNLIARYGSNGPDYISVPFTLVDDLSPYHLPLKIALALYIN